MRRVSVVGSWSGAGKTTFARALARQADLPFVELDALHWRQIPRILRREVLWVGNRELGAA